MLLSSLCPVCDHRSPAESDLSDVKPFRQTLFGGFDSERQHNGDDNGSLQPNSFLFVPTTTTPPSLPWFASAAPSPGATDVPLRPLPIIILNHTTHVNTGSIVLHLKGAKVSNSSSVSGTTTGGSGRHPAEIRQFPFTQAERGIGFEHHEHHLFGRQYSAEISVIDSFDMRLIAVDVCEVGRCNAGILSNLNPGNYVKHQTAKCVSEPS
jgi:hypothetical protein